MNLVKRSEEFRFHSQDSPSFVDAPKFDVMKLAQCENYMTSASYLWEWNNKWLLQRCYSSGNLVNISFLGGGRILPKYIKAKVIKRDAHIRSLFFWFFVSVCMYVCHKWEGSQDKWDWEGLRGSWEASEVMREHKRLLGKPEQLLGGPERMLGGYQ